MKIKPLNAIKKYAATSWDFCSANTTLDTHCYHTYPAMMIPQIAARLNAKLFCNRKRLESYPEKIKTITSTTKVYDFNSSDRIAEIEKESMDIAVTSPPDGDNKTTVAYEQFSHLVNQVLGVESESSFDNERMSGSAKEIQKTGIDIVDKAVQQVAEIDAKRVKDVYSFYHDYLNSIKNVAAVVKRKGYVYYVVGNRLVKNITLPACSRHDL